MKWWQVTAVPVSGPPVIVAGPVAADGYSEMKDVFDGLVEASADAAETAALYLHGETTRSKRSVDVALLSKRSRKAKLAD